LKITVFEGYKELTFVHVRSALDVLGTDRSVDTRSDGGLRQRGKDGVGGNLFRDRTNGGVFGLHRDGRTLRVLLIAGGFLATGDRECE
jgi:hypothetical protein